MKPVKAYTNGALNLLYHTGRVYKMVGDKSYKPSHECLRVAKRAKLSFPLSKYREGGSKASYFDRLAALAIGKQITSAEKLIELARTIDPKFATALQLQWKVYRPHWVKNEARFYKEVEERLKAPSRLGEVRGITRNNITVTPIVVEAHPSSASWIGPGISVSGLGRKGQLENIHESFHLHLKEKWAKLKGVKEVLDNHKGYVDKGWGNHINGKIEQAIVVSLDSLVHGHDEKHVKNYFKGCNTSDFYNAFYPPIKKWYNEEYKKGGRKSLDDVITQLVRNNEKLIFSHPVSSRVIAKQLARERRELASENSVKSVKLRRFFRKR